MDHPSAADQLLTDVGICANAYVLIDELFDRVELDETIPPQFPGYYYWDQFHQLLLPLPRELTDAIESRSDASAAAGRHYPQGFELLHELSEMLHRLCGYLEDLGLDHVGLLATSLGHDVGEWAKELEEAPAEEQAASPSDTDRRSGMVGEGQYVGGDAEVPAAWEQSSELSAAEAGDDDSDYEESDGHESSDTDETLSDGTVEPDDDDEDMAW